MYIFRLYIIVRGGGIDGKSAELTPQPVAVGLKFEPVSALTLRPNTEVIIVHVMYYCILKTRYVKKALHE